MSISESFDLAIPGCRLLAMPEFRDARGLLRALDLRSKMGFDASRLFVITLPADATGITRGGHCNSTPQVLMALVGQVTINLDAGFAQATVLLDRPDIALLLGPGVVIHMRDYADGTLLLGLAEAPYDATVQRPEPMPEFFHRASMDCPR